MATETPAVVQHHARMADVTFVKRFSSDTWTANNGQIYLDEEMVISNYRDWTIARFKQHQLTPKLDTGFFLVNNRNKTVPSYVKGRYDDVIAWAMAKPVYFCYDKIDCQITAIQFVEV